MQLEYIEQTFKDNEKIKGNLGYLDDVRLVFVGKKDDQKDRWYVGFRNSEGEDTKLSLSLEAMAMLVQLYNKHPKGNDVFPIVIKTAWQVTVSDPAPSAP